MPKNRRNPLAIGEKIGRLKVVEYVGSGRGGKRFLCLCDCGNTKIVIGAELRNGHTKSCGCLFKEVQLRTVTKHNKRYTRIYEVWRSMKKRCLNPNCKAYKNYGGRGIKVCEEWLGKDGFTNFYNWAMANGYEEHLTIDRKDVNGNYEPSNCKWATRSEQNNNKRNSLFITYNNETHTVAEWAKLLNINPTTIYSRLNRGWKPEMALKPAKELERVIY